MPLPYFQRKLLAGNASELHDEEVLAALLYDGTTSPKTTLQLANCILESSYWSRDLNIDTLKKLDNRCQLTTNQKVRLLAALEFLKSMSPSASRQHDLIEKAEDAVAFVKDMENLQQEHLRVMLLDSHQYLMKIHTAYIGTVDTLIFRASELFREAIALNCPAIILVHNHPSGDPTPSTEDIFLTQRVAQAAELLDIQLIDHIIISKSGWHSILTMTDSD